MFVRTCVRSFAPCPLPCPLPLGLCQAPSTSRPSSPSLGCWGGTGCRQSRTLVHPSPSLARAACSCRLSNACSSNACSLRLVAFLVLVRTLVRSLDSHKCFSNKSTQRLDRCSGLLYIVTCWRERPTNTYHKEQQCHSSSSPFSPSSSSSS